MVILINPSASPAKIPPPLLLVEALLITVTLISVSGLPALVYRPPPNCCDWLFEMTRFWSSGCAEPVIWMAPPQPAGQAPPSAWPPAKVSPEMSVVLVMLAPVTVMTRWPDRALRIVLALLAPIRLTALSRVTLVM